MRSPNLDMERGPNVDLFQDKFIRRQFIQKVYCILTMQLIVTLGIIYVFVISDEVKYYVLKRPVLIYTALGVAIFTVIVLSCFPNVRRKEPLNYIFLGIFTAAEGFLMGVISSTYEPIIVLSAVGITAAVCFALTLFAMQTKIDFTVMGGFLLIILCVFLIFGLITFFYRTHTIKLIYCSVGVIIFSLYLLYDTQLMIGGDHQFSIGPDEHVFAALSLYIDIVQIFLYILTLLGDSD